MCWRARASCCLAPTRRIATLERYKARLDEVSNTLSALEIEDLVTVRDATIVLQRLEMVRRIADEIVGYVVELGTDGRLLGAAAGRAAGRRRHGPAADRAGLPACGTPRAQFRIGHGRTGGAVCNRSARPHRAWLEPWASVERRNRSTQRPVPGATGCCPVCPGCPSPCWIACVEQFGGLQKLLAASVEELEVIDGLGGGAGEVGARSHLPARGCINNRSVPVMGEDVRSG